MQLRKLRHESHTLEKKSDRNCKNLVANVEAIAASNASNLICFFFKVYYCPLTISGKRTGDIQTERDDEHSQCAHEENHCSYIYINIHWQYSHEVPCTDRWVGNFFSTILRPRKRSIGWAIRSWNYAGNSFMQFSFRFAKKSEITWSSYFKKIILMFVLHILKIISFSV